VSDPADTKNPFQLDYQVATANFFDWTKRKSEITVPLSQINLQDADEDNSGPDAEPVQLGAPGEYRFRVKLELPAKYTARAPLPFSMKRDYAQYEASYKVEGTVFTAERRLVTEERELPAARVSDYLAFRRAVLADTAQHLSIDGTAAGAPTPGADMKGSDLYDAANGALERGNFQTAVDLLKRVVEADPKHKTAWLNLGRAYMGMRQTDKAIDAFHHQADANPYDEYAFNSLGWD